MSFRTVALGGICSLGDGAHARITRQDSGVPYLTSKNIKQGELDLTRVDYISEMDYKKHFSKSGNSVRSLEAGDILIGIIGTFGNVYLYKETDNFGISSSIGIIRPDKERVNPEFLYYTVTSNNFKQTIEMYKGGSVQGYTNLPTLRKVKVSLPPLEEQKEIANILKSLDKRIQLNKSINKNLEEMAQALFKRWFVDYEFPNENGEPYKSSGGEFEESELGLIPKGWKLGSLSELGEVVGGATPSKKNDEYYTNQGIPWITPKDLSINKNKYISRGQIDITEEGFKKSSTRVLPKGTVLFSSRAPIGYIAISINEVTTNQGFKSIIPFKQVGSEFIYYLLKYNTDNIESRASGSTFKEISGGEMKRVPVLIPSLGTIAQFDNTAKPIGDLIEKCEKENESLVLIRDTLLPKLMSGEIRVPVEQEYTLDFGLPMVAESSEKYSAH